MKFKNDKLGAFIVPTGIGASVGGFAGDASVYARKFAREMSLIVNPNVVNAGCFSGITENMFYVEGFNLDEFFRGNIELLPSINNKIGVVFDKSIPKDVLNIHINTINAVKTVYGVDVFDYEITKEPVGVEFFVDESNISTGGVKNIQTILESSKSLIKKGADAIAIVCLFEEEDEQEGENYAQGSGVDPIGGVEAIISHYISRELKIPCAHSPAFEDCSISSDIVDARASSEFITPTFLPCVLLGLEHAPKISIQKQKGISVSDLDYLIMPYNALGSTPVFEALKKDIKIYAVKENQTVLDINKKALFDNKNIIEIENYEKCLELIKNS